MNWLIDWLIWLIDQKRLTRRRRRRRWSSPKRPMISISESILRCAVRSCMDIPDVTLKHCQTQDQFSQLSWYWYRRYYCLAYQVAYIAKTTSLNGHFPGGAGLAGTRLSPFWILLELRVMEVVVTTGAINRAKLQSKCHHQQTNIHILQAGCPPVA